MGRLQFRSKFVRHTASAALILCFLGLWTLQCFAEGQPAAQPLQSEITIQDPAGVSYNHKQLLDGRTATKLELPGRTEMTIHTQEKIRGIYLIWDKPPGLWALQAEEATRTSMYLQGENGWIHEYVELSEPASDLTLVMPDSPVLLCELSLYGQGVLPDSVQVWEPPYSDADMLLLPTHADDEHLFFGGTMPYYAGELGYKVQVAYLTNHWAEPYRSHELLNGLWTVGIRAYPVISDFPDYYSDSLEHAKGLYDLDQMFAFQTGLLRRFKPEVVIGHDIQGEYGHGVHMLNAWVLQQAVTLAAQESYLPEQIREWGAFQTSKVYLHLYPENPLLMDWNIPLKAFGGRTAFEMTEAGFAQHLSQQQYFSVRTDGVYDCRAFGLYYTNVGEDSADQSPDFFQNIEVFSDEPAQDPRTEPAETDPEPLPEGDAGNGSSPFWAAPGIQKAIGVTGILAAIFMVFLLWGRNRNQR